MKNENESFSFYLFLIQKNEKQKLPFSFYLFLIQKNEKIIILLSSKIIINING